MTTSTDTPTTAAPQLPSAIQPQLDIIGWLLTYTNDETEFSPGPVKPQPLAADYDGIAAVVLLCDAVRFARQTVSQRITHLEAEVARLKQREHICETMDRAEKIALVRALQECAEALGIGNTNLSPAALVAAFTAAINERNELRAKLAEIEAQEPVVWMRESDAEWLAVRGYMTVSGECDGGWRSPLYARPLPAQAVPDGERQAVLLTDEQIDDAQRATFDGLMDHIAEHGVCAEGERYHARRAARAIESAALAANNLEVRRG